MERIVPSRGEYWGRTGAAVAAAASLIDVGDVLLATDADWLFDEVSAALSGNGVTVSRVRDGSDVQQVVELLKPDLVILDLQVGNKGGIATCLDLRLEEGMDRLQRSQILLLLDREADRWLARSAEADGWMIKPVDAFRLRKAYSAMTTGNSWFEGDSEPVASGS